MTGAKAAASAMNKMTKFGKKDAEKKESASGGHSKHLNHDPSWILRGALLTCDPHARR